MSGLVGHVAELRRYPVKSLVGEELTEAQVDRRGLVGDRLWSVRDQDGKFGSGKSTRRFRRMEGLLDLSAVYDGGEVPVVTFPDGDSYRGDDPAVHAVLSKYVGREVTLAREEAVSHFDEGPVHLVTTSAIAYVQRAHGRVVDPARLRPNLVVDTDAPGLLEDAWAGREVTIGEELVLRIGYRMPRCVMVNLPQRGLPADRGLLGLITEVNDGGLGVVADVVRPGRVSRGDPVRVVAAR
ncbi:MAG TPA: MOSC N-terminal beta barrel domain-containing protein [Nocardioidaceae bacterium]|nr:MOSC N-terminal beta barrel domain-containing protein [Nocardioidaceae bacterium]